MRQNPQTKNKVDDVENSLQKIAQNAKKKDK